jgi:hypothetical protein
LLTNDVNGDFFGTLGEKFLNVLDVNKSNKMQFIFISLKIVSKAVIKALMKLFNLGLRIFYELSSKKAAYYLCHGKNVICTSAEKTLVHVPLE